MSVTDLSIPKRQNTRAWLLPCLAVLCVFILLVLPVFASRSVVQDMFRVLTLLALAQLWNLLAGYAGLVSVGQQAFVGLGGYTLFACAVLFGLNPLVAIGVSGLIAALISLPTAWFLFRLQGAYFAVGTWVTAEIFRLSLAQWKVLGGGTGTSLPRDFTRDLPGLDFVKDVLGLKTSAAIDVIAYWLAAFMAIMVIGLIFMFLRSKNGLGLSAIRDSAVAAGSVGVSASRLKLFCYVAVAFGTGCVGALIYMQTGRISPDAGFSLMDWTAFVIFIVVIGGIGTLEGPIVGVIIFWLLQTLLSDLGTWYLMILGGLAIVVMLFAPQGIWGWISSRTGWSIFSTRRHFDPA